MKFFNIRVFTKRKIFFLIIMCILINYLSYSNYQIVDNYDMPLLQSPWTETFLIYRSTASFLNSIGIFILSGFLAADFLLEERNNGLIDIIITKKPIKNHLISTAIYNFIIAGIFSILPALVNLLMWFLLRVNVPLVYFNTMNIDNSDLFAGVFMKSPLLFYILNFIKIFIIGGSIANLSLFIATKYKNKYLAITMTYIIDCLLMFVFGFFGLGQGAFKIMLTNMIYPDMLTIVELLIFNIIPIIYLINLYKDKDIIWKD